MKHPLNLSHNTKSPAPKGLLGITKTSGHMAPRIDPALIDSQHWFTQVVSEWGEVLGGGGQAPSGPKKPGDLFPPTTVKPETTTPKNPGEVVQDPKGGSPSGPDTPGNVLKRIMSLYGYDCGVWKPATNDSHVWALFMWDCPGTEGYRKKDSVRRGMKGLGNFLRGER